MHNIILTILMMLVFFVSNSLAFDAVSLEKMGVFDKEKGIVGTCGEVAVYLKNYDDIIKGEVYNKYVPAKSGKNTVKEVIGDGYITTSDQTRLVLKVGEKIETLSVKNGALSDYLGVNCMVNPKGRKFLLLRTNCSGSACGEQFHHVIFDTKNLKIINPLDSARCDEKCFKKNASRLSIIPIKQ